MNSPGKLQCDGSFGLSLYTLSPELKFRINGPVEDEILLEALGVKGTDRRVMTHLLRHPSEPQIIPGEEQTFTVVKCSF